MTTVFKKRKIKSSCSSRHDRFSDLPECVTSHILSRLPTKDALRTCVLSRDWKHKWKSIYNIDINDECPIDTDSEGLTDSEDECKPLLMENRVASFRSYVNKVVDSTHDLRISSFRLVLGDTSHDSRYLQKLMCKVLGHGVDKLSIVTRRSRGKISLPSCLGRHTFLTELKLSLNCTMKIRSVNCYPKLTSLYLCGRGGKFRIENRQSNETGHLSLTFPVLKNLQLYCFKFKSAKSVEINVPELVNFRGGICYSHSLIKIVAPKLIKFDVYDFENYDLCAPSLGYASLMGESDDASRATGFLKGFPRLTCLRISGSMAKAILRRKEVNTLHCLERLQKLSVYCSSTKEILDLLQLTPNIQSLTLHNVHRGALQQPLRWKGVNALTCLERLQEVSVYRSRTKEIFDLLQLTPNIQSLTLSFVHHGALQQPLPPCIVSQLKHVEIFDLCGDSDQIINLANLFLEKATKLETVLVYLRKGLAITDEKIDCWLANLGTESSIKLRIV